MVLCVPGKSRKPGSVAPPDTRAETSGSTEEGSHTVYGGDCFEESAHHLRSKFLLLQIKETMRMNIWPHIHTSLQGFPGDSAVKNPPAMQKTQEMWVQSLGWEDPLEEGMATHSSILAWRIPGTEEPGGLQFIGLQRVGDDWSDWAGTCTTHISVGLPTGKLWGSRIQWNAGQKSSLLADACRAAVPVAIWALGIMSGLSQHYLSFSFKNIWHTFSRWELIALFSNLELSLLWYFSNRNDLFV